MTQFRHTIQQHHLHMKSPVRLSHINLYHCDSSPSDIFPDTLMLKSFLSSRDMVS